MPKRYQRNPTLELVQPIHLPPTKILERQQLEELVELPLLAACRALYDLNVPIVDSSANRNHLLYNDPAFIRLPFNLLSIENQEIGRLVGQYESVCGHEGIYLVIPLPPDKKVVKISAAAERLARRFHYQSLAWAGRNLQEMRRRFKSAWTIEQFAANGAFFDAQSGLFFDSAEHLLKQRRYYEQLRQIK